MDNVKKISTILSLQKRLLAVAKPVSVMLLALAFMSCDRHYSADRIHDIPKMDEAFLTTAINHLNNSIEDYPSNPDNYYKKALILMEYESYGSALLQARKAHSLNSADPEYLYLLARLYAINNKPEEALDAAIKAAKAGAPKPPLYHLLAQVYLEKDSVDMALKYIESAIALNPSDNAYYFARGKVLLAKNDTAAAVHDFEKTLAGGFVHKDAHLALLNIHKGQGNFEKASQVIEESLKDFPGDKEILVQKADVLNRTNQPAKAKVIYEKLISVDSTYQEAYNSLANYFYLHNKFDSANYYAERSLALGKGKIFPMLVQARIFDRTRKYYEAISKYESILAIDSTYKTAADELRYVKNKIAYMQRQKAAERQRELQVMPTIEPVF